MADPDPAKLSGCDESLPLLPITRQFDFGQFVFLRQPQPPPAQAGGTTSAASPGSSNQIVLDPSGGVYQAYKDWLERRQKLTIEHGGKHPLDPKRGPKVFDPLGGVSLHRVITGPTKTGDAPVTFEVAAERLAGVMTAGEVVHDGSTYALDLSGAAWASLAGGRSTLVMAHATSGPMEGEPFMAALSPLVESRNLSAEEMDLALADGELHTDGTAQGIDVDKTVARSLLAGKAVVVRVEGDAPGIVRLVPPAPAIRPAATEITIGDLSAFLTRPSVPDEEGRPIPVQLDARAVRELREGGATVLVVNETQITIHDGQRNGEVASASFAQTSGGSSNAGTYWPNGGASDDGDGEDDPSASDAGTPAAVDVATVVRPFEVGYGMTSSTGHDKPKEDPKKEPAPGRVVAPLGLPVAVFMPWRQTWKLVGFSRGELRSSLALAPQEETTIEVSSWERRLRSLDQASSTEVEQSFETLQTERETDDVFQELTKRHDFAWQLEGSVDATYNAGTGSINVTAGGQVTDATQLQQIARNTQQRMKESTQKAAAKVRAVRTTHITDSIETGSQERVTRHIRNPNFTHTLTLDFFETLAHYEVTLAPVAQRLGLVALLPNPMATKQFDRARMRRNESALRRALLDPALSDGFDGCRMIEAYEAAKDILAQQALEAKPTDEANDKPTTDDKPAANANKPSPQELQVVSVLTQISKAADTTSKQAQNVAAMTAINADRQVTEAERRNAQYWLFRKLCAKYLPSLLDAMDNLPDSPTIANAAALIAVVPPPGSATTLGNLNDKSDWDKEQAGLGPEIARIIGAEFKWGWSTGRCREEGLYTANDAGLAGLLERFSLAHKEWEAKKAEGEMAKAKDVVIAQANAKQDALSTEDKLAMAFPLDELASAYEREDALRAHLNEHTDHYSFALFQALSPAEQNAYIESASSGALQVGMFEPRVIAINGAQLAVPLSPPPQGPLRDLLDALRKSFEDAFKNTASDPDTFIFPTPGLTINSRLGACSAAEEFIEESRTIELRRLAAEAELAEQEAKRRAARIDAGDLEDPDVDAAPLHVSIDKPA